jgi:hypothetical protein
MEIDKNKHLECVLKSIKISNEQALLNKHISKKDEIKEALEKKFGANIYSPFNSGSYAKNTAINTKFDFDLVVPFKRNAFNTLQVMYDEMYDFLNEKYKSFAVVKKQKVSIGLDFFADADNDIIKIDIVPGREFNQDQYAKDNNLNLYVFSRYGKIEEGSDRLKTNVQAQINNIKNNADKSSIRQMIRLLKVWKVSNQKNAKSFFLELIIIKAFENNDITGTLWDKLKTVMEFIRDEIKTIKLPDPGNNNNDVADSLSDIEKEILSFEMKTMINNIVRNSVFIENYYPVNSKFPCEEEKKYDNRYGIKETGLSVPPITRFG